MNDETRKAFNIICYEQRVGEYGKQQLWNMIKEAEKQGRIKENQFWIEITEDDITNIDLQNRIKELQ